MKLMRLFILVCCITLLSGCAGFGDSRRCQIKGEPFQGIFPLIKDSAKTTKVMMVHGVGKHDPGYSTQLREGLANKMGLNQISKITKNITLNDWIETDKEFGNLRITRSTNEDESHELLFYELTWSELTDNQKAMLAYDMSGEYSFRRAFVNEKIKEFTNDVLPDQMLYVGDAREDILISVGEALCWMISKPWHDLPVTGNRACTAVDLKTAVVSMKNDHYAFITHSLGSRIVIDGLQRLARIHGDKKNERRVKVKKVLAGKFNQAFRELRIPIFMLANQLPLFQITREPPEITGQYDAYCRAEGEHYNLRTLSEIDIIAFSDPNDILSYTITEEFMDRYLDSRLCIDTTNININVADVTGIFGIDYANPLDAHVGYETDERVIALIANGVGNKDTSPIITERCRTVITTDN